MLKTNYPHNPLNVSLFTMLFCITLFLSGCNEQESEQTSQSMEVAQEITVLNAQNINAYARDIANEFLTKQQSLLGAFHSAKQNNNSFSFVQYRNNVWSEDFMVLKQKYADTYLHNKAFLSTYPATPLFLLYDNMMYIGLDLKNGLLDGDEVLQQKALDAAENDHQEVLKIIKWLDSRP